MAKPLPSNRQLTANGGTTEHAHSGAGQELADLRIFWGPEICRLEYLVHLVDTGRIKDERRPKTA